MSSGRSTYWGALLGGKRPLLGGESRLYSVRGLVVLVLIFLVTAVTVDSLRPTTDLPEAVVAVAGFATGVAVVLGPVVAYYWWQADPTREPA